MKRKWITLAMTFQKLTKFENLVHENDLEKEQCGICISREELFNEFLIANLGGVNNIAESEPFKILDRKTGVLVTKYDASSSSCDEYIFNPNIGHISPNALRCSSHSKALLFSFAGCIAGWTAGCTARCNAWTTGWSSGCTAGGDELGASLEALSSSLRPLFFSQILPDVLFVTLCTEVACSLLCSHGAAGSAHHRDLRTGAKSAASCCRRTYKSVNL